MQQEPSRWKERVLQLVWLLVKHVLYFDRVPDRRGKFSIIYQFLISIVKILIRFFLPLSFCLSSLYASHFGAFISSIES